MNLPFTTALPTNTPGRSLAGAVGNTPVLWISEPFTPPERGFWAKLESFNPGGIKDRPALHMTARARERGELRPGAPVVESTSGTFGLGLVLAGRIHGHPVTLVTDPGLEPDMDRLLRAQGARVVIVTDPHPAGAGRRPAESASPSFWLPPPDRGAPTSTTTPTTSTRTNPWRTNSSPSSAGSTSW
jgi:cysteine synthase A